MSTKVTCNICNKSVSCRDLIKCSLCITMVHFKYNNLNVADAAQIDFVQIDFDRFCSKNLFPFATINDHKLYQTLSKSNPPTLADLTAILLKHVQH